MRLREVANRTLAIADLRREVQLNQMEQRSWRKPLRSRLKPPLPSKLRAADAFMIRSRRRSATRRSCALGKSRR
ncbi:protein of unknown function [Methylocella tundrae]|uniref:Uncharacterized protein n=1 Tax=Methylocella tundrae TaxID=227605 RepID=A0A4U8YV02_METTU|nr:protein of unknown function [Methylocella tundrae]